MGGTKRACPTQWASRSAPNDIDLARNMRAVYSPRGRLFFFFFTLGCKDGLYICCFQTWAGQTKHANRSDVAHGPLCDSETHGALCRQRGPCSVSPGNSLSPLQVKPIKLGLQQNSFLYLEMSKDLAFTL